MSILTPQTLGDGRLEVGQSGHREIELSITTEIEVEISFGEDDERATASVKKSLPAWLSERDILALRDLCDEALR